jgi:hypothetical protein
MQYEEYDALNIRIEAYLQATFHKNARGRILIFSLSKVYIVLLIC